MKLSMYLKTYIQEIREKFSEYYFKARSGFRLKPGKRDRKRSEPLTRYEESEEDLPLSKSENFKVETFLSVLDSLISEPTKRAETYSLIGNLFPSSVN